MLKILSVPNKILGKQSREVKNFDGKLNKIVRQMNETLIAQKDPQGVGLAANQVGLDLAIFIMRPKPDSPTEVIINPKIILSEGSATGGAGGGPPQRARVSETEHWGEETRGRTRRKNSSLEGCLSIPRIWSPVVRSKRVRLKYQDLTGKKKTKWFVGFRAVIVQHEVDHLNGVLFTQRALLQKVPLYEERNEKLEKIEH